MSLLNLILLDIIYNAKSNIDWTTIAMVLLTSIIVIISFRSYKKNNKHLETQLFETTFFNMMKQLEDIVSKLIIEDSRIVFKNSNFITGREVFRFMFNESYTFIYDDDFIRNVDNKGYDLFLFPNVELQKEMKDDSVIFPYIIKTKGIINIISYLGIKGYETCSDINLLDHYFRYLYRIMRFVDEADFLEINKSDITKRYKYMGILRATLSPYELVFLFYNDLSKYGNEKVKPLIEKYSILKSLRKELLANTMMDYDLNLINDEFDNDYERYIETKSPEKEFNRSFKYKASAISKVDNEFINRKL